jgi:hypothetical protein
VFAARTPRDLSRAAPRPWDEAGFATVADRVGQRSKERSSGTSLATDTLMNAPSDSARLNGRSSRYSSSIVCGPDTPTLFGETLQALRNAGVDFLIGGAFALARYTGIDRTTKDLDVFLRQNDCPRALEVLAAIGCQTEWTFRHWLAKARRDDALIDVIYSSGNGVATVDDQWFAHAPEAEVCGIRSKLSPPEELIWSKSFVMERERFDGADIMHVIHGIGPDLDWPRLIARFGDHWRVLLSHLVMYAFVYPSERHRVPAWVADELTQRLASGWSDDLRNGRTCYGTLLSRQQYLHDVERGGYIDGRLVTGSMTPGEIAEWTGAIEQEE